MVRLLALSSFFTAVLADISLQAFDQMGCGGNVINNVHSNPSAPKDGSGCIALNQFQSVGIVSADPGFKCNVYSDAACQSFLESFTSAGTCTNVIATGIICFSQALFDNPFAESSVQVQLGTKVITVDAGGGVLVQDGKNQACGTSGCDPSNPFSKSFQHFNKDCSLTVTMTGNYDNTNERDYMAALLAQTMNSAETNARQDLTGSSEDNDNVLDLPSFAQVVINDKNGNNQAQMTVQFDVACNPPSSGDCNSLLSQVTSAVLGEVPAVGGLLAEAFSIVCSTSG
ncbi:hypothetical protein TWF694_002033 [Orbilia ellipsospora]|uniref:Uncharacterized protein n=1 Tax=Orbilia ellipsospora TaxID=2528407 RepID=A0AAV9X5K3_9PEZI